MTKDNEIGADGLPLGWASESLGFALPIIYGKGLIEEKRNSSGSVPVYGSSGVVGTHDVSLTNGPTLIVGRKGSVGAVHLSKVPCWPIDTVYYTVGSSCFNLTFAAYLLRFLNLRELDKSTAVPGLSRDDYSKLKVSIPPLPEQHRIVAEIEHRFSLIDAAIANLKRAQANLKRYRASVLQAACTGKLVPTEAELAHSEGRDYEPADVLLQRILAERRARWEADQLAKMRAAGKEPKDDKWKAKYEEPAPPDTSDLPELPQGWVLATLDSIAEVVSGFAFDSKDFVQEGTKVIKISNIGYGIFEDKQQQYLSPSFLQKYQGYIVTSGTLLLALTRPITNGSIKACLYPNSEPVALLNQRVAMLLPQTGLLTAYLLCLLQSDYFKKFIKENVNETLQPNLSPIVLKGLLILLPPLTEQDRIVAEVERRLTVADHMEATLAANLKRAERLKQSILRDAFAGKLVPQDPNDEPASKLLERIRAERSVAKPDPSPKTTRQKRVVDHPELAFAEKQTDV